MLLSGPDAWTLNKPQVESLDIPLPRPLTDFESLDVVLKSLKSKNAKKEYASTLS